VKEQAVDSYCNFISEVCGSAGEAFQFDPQQISYSPEVGMTIPFAVNGEQVADPLVFGETIS
jgi:hypothetical protein